jgi:hypothetical protein
MQQHMRAAVWAIFVSWELSSTMKVDFKENRSEYSRWSMVVMMLCIAGTLRGRVATKLYKNNYELNLPLSIY